MQRPWTQLTGGALFADCILCYRRFTSDEAEFPFLTRWVLVPQPSHMNLWLSYWQFMIVSLWHPAEGFAHGLLPADYWPQHIGKAHSCLSLDFMHAFTSTPRMQDLLFTFICNKSRYTAHVRVFQLKTGELDCRLTRQSCRTQLYTHIQLATLKHCEKFCGWRDGFRGAPSHSSQHTYLLWLAGAFQTLSSYALSLHLHTNRRLIPALIQVWEVLCLAKLFLSLWFANQWRCIERAGKASRVREPNYPQQTAPASTATTATSILSINWTMLRLCADSSCADILLSPTVTRDGS